MNTPTDGESEGRGGAASIPPTPTSTLTPTLTPTPSPPPAPLALDFACGMVAGVAYTISAHPFDTVKVAMQSAPSGQPHKSALATARGIVAGPAGALGLFRGLSAPLVGYSLECGINYSAFNQARRWMERNNPMRSGVDSSDVSAGSDAGGASGSGDRTLTARAKHA